MHPQTVYKILVNIGFSPQYVNPSSLNKEVEEVGSFPWTDDQSYYVSIKHIGKDVNDLVFFIEMDDTSKPTDFPVHIYQKAFNLNNQEQYNQFFELAKVISIMMQLPQGEE